jgi:hypothetical protein
MCGLEPPHDNKTSQPKADLLVACHRLIEAAGRMKSPAAWVLLVPLLLLLSLSPPLPLAHARYNDMNWQFRSCCEK